MNKENLAAWVRALVSGEYLQVTGQLAKSDRDAEKGARYCCLGVACDVSGVGAWVRPAHNGLLYDVDEYNEELSLPVQVAEWLFRDAGEPVSTDPALRSEDGRIHPASVWNDRFHSSFLDIAKMIVSTYGLDPELIPEEHR